MNYSDLRSIFDAAAIHYYDDLKKLRKKKRLSGSDREALAWYEHMVKVLDLIKLSVDAGIHATYPTKVVRPLTKKERLATVTAERNERVLIDGLVARALETLRSRSEATV